MRTTLLRYSCIAMTVADVGPLKAQNVADPFAPPTVIAACESIKPDSAFAEIPALMLTFEEGTEISPPRTLHAEYDSAGKPMGLAVLRKKENAAGRSGLEMTAVKFNPSNSEASGVRAWRPAQTGAASASDSTNVETFVLTAAETKKASELAILLRTKGCNERNRNF